MKMQSKGLFKKRQFNVGLDVGNYCVKSVKLEILKDLVELVDYYSSNVGSSQVQAIKNVAGHSDIKLVNASCAGTSSIIRYVSFPKMNADELKKALKFEAQKFIPFSVQEVNLDAAIIRNDLPDNKMLIAIAAVKKEFLNQRLKLIQDADLKINFIDVDSLALINAFNFNYKAVQKPKTIALLNIGSIFTNLNILEEGIPALSRDMNIAGNNFTQKISEILSLDLSAAEEFKLNPDKERLNKVAPLIESIASTLANEIRVSFDYYESQSASSVSKIFLTGGGSLFLGLKDALSNLLGIEVEIWDPFRIIKINANVNLDKLRQVGPQFAIAVGLALRQ